ncbi:MAG: aryl-sulfate sulfotransferase [Bacteroidetes bacterium]|nr:aryl-sulfate sulfotransferase [Bacteroidota bacterium]
MMGHLMKITMFRRYNSIILVSILLLIITSLCFPQNSHISSYQFISPVPNSSMLLPETNIIIREGNLINAASLFGTNIIKVIGSKSGTHAGKLILSDDGKTIIFKPYKNFTYSETINVSYYSGIYKLTGEELLPFNFTFIISDKNSYTDYNRAIEDLLEMDIKSYLNSTPKLKRQKLSITNDGLPEDFPTVTVNTFNNPSSGYLFLAPFTFPFIPWGYLMIVDNKGVPIFYQRTHSIKADWKLQPNGMLTYVDISKVKYYEMDSSYAIIDSFSTGNGYTTDTHELQILPDGHALLMAYDYQTVRMDTVVQGGDSSATVIGLIVQELDVDKNVVFQWRSWDHFQITDATEDIDLTAATIDYVHGNAIELDDDGNLLISCRHMDEITKINRQTGEIIWRLGGLKSRNNQFLFINDEITFSHQHDIRRLPNGNLTIFDNGNLHDPRFSRSLEYQLDESNLIVSLVWDYNNEPETYSLAMGSTQRLQNHNTVIGWGWSFEDARALSEIEADGTVALELSLPDTMLSYRAFKFSWKTNLFITNPDSIFFESIPVGDSSIIKVNLINNSDDAINITSFYNSDSAYTVVNPVPFVLPPFGTIPVNIIFKPIKDGYFKDYLHIRSDTDTSRIAQVLVMGGRTDSTISTIQDENPQLTYRLEQNYPNPFNPITKITYSVPVDGFVKLAIYNLLGEKVADLVNTNVNRGTYEVTFDAIHFASGIYLYRMESGNFVSIKKMMILK